MCARRTNKTTDSMSLWLGKDQSTSFDSQISTEKTLVEGEGIHSMKTYDQHLFTSRDTK